MSNTIVTENGDTITIEVYESGVNIGDGSDQGVWFSGDGAPAAGVGSDGDFYLDSTANQIYGPKASGAWGSAISLGGAPGADGADGKSLLNGTTDPDSGDGADGDFYLNTTTNEMFGPKSGPAWGTGTSIIGPQGPTGATGAQGPQGDAGPTGATGAQGPAGNDGADGADGTNGADGKTILNGNVDPVVGDGVDGDFFLNTASNTLFGPKTGGAWGSGVSLVGPTGATGPQGPAGPGGSATQWRTGSGVPADSLGVDNDLYLNTDNGDIHQKSGGAYSVIDNITGPTGATGAAGSNGADGSDGADGLTILNGAGAPSGGTGNNGDFYIDTTNNEIFGPKTGGAWGAGTSLVGPTGAQGAAGANGTDGTDGIDGRTVLNGTVDPVGGDGADGDFYINTSSNTLFGPKSGTWPAGVSLVGPQGATGAQGPAGNDGADGADGTTPTSGTNNDSTVFDCTNIAGIFSNMTTPHAGPGPYTVAASPFAGGFEKKKINMATEPTVTGATKQFGPDFQASTDMFMTTWHDGVTTWFFFERIT